jgi:hypothetical protein
VLSRAGAMGLLAKKVDPPSVDKDSVIAALHRIEQANIARDIVPRISAVLKQGTASRETDERIRQWLASILDALDESPAPKSELPRLSDILGPKLLARLILVSPSSLERYKKGERATPTLVAARAHFLATVVSHLQGAYNEIGTQRWFDRKRALLDGRAPVELLRDHWQPETPDAQRVLELARSLVGSGAT